MSDQFPDEVQDLERCSLEDSRFLVLVLEDDRVPVILLDPGFRDRGPLRVSSDVPGREERVREYRSHPHIPGFAPQSVPETNETDIRHSIPDTSLQSILL